MAKRKRFTIPTESTSQAPTSANSLPQDPTSANSLTQAPTVAHALPQNTTPANSLTQAPSSSNSLPQAPINSSPIEGSSYSRTNVSSPVDSSSHDEIPQQSQRPRQHVRRESPSHWTVDAIDPQGATKRIKLKIWDVVNLPIGERVIVPFDEQNTPYGEAQALLAGYCGILATNHQLFPINFERWNGETGMPKAYKDNCFATDLKPRFQFLTTEDLAKRYCNLNISKKWAAHRQSLWKEIYDRSKTRAELISSVPDGVDRIQWAHFVNYRLKPETQARCKKNEENRRKQVIPHRGGSKALSRKRHEMFLEMGRKPNRGEVYLEIHPPDKESSANDAAMATIEQIKTGLTESSVDESEISPDDVIGRVFGPEHSGRVRSMGMGAVPSNTFRNKGVRLSKLTNISAATSTSSDTDWKAKFTSLESAFKAYIIMKEGRIPDEVASFFGPNSTDLPSEPNSPLNTRGSCGGSNI